MNGMGSLTIPLLPCVSWDDTLEFWQMLGFEVALKQRSPNAYAVIRRDDYELHLFGLKQLKPEENFSTCPVIVPEVEALHHTFAEGLRTALGKVPMKGWPRITRMKPGQSRFTVTDNAGNSVIFIKRGDEDNEAAFVRAQALHTEFKQLALSDEDRQLLGPELAAMEVLERTLTK